MPFIGGHLNFRAMAVFLKLPIAVSALNVTAVTELCGYHRPTLVAVLFDERKQFVLLVLRPVVLGWMECADVVSEQVVADVESCEVVVVSKLAPECDCACGSDAVA
jgi:hypothetical protein